MNNRRIAAAAVYLAFSVMALGQVSITTKSLPSGGVGSGYNAEIDAANSEVFQWTVSGLPPGVSQTVMGSAVILSGTPTAGGIYTVTASVTNPQAPAPDTATKQFTVAILQITTPSPLPNAFTAKSYSVSFTAAYTPGPFVWNVQSESQSPVPGLTFSSTGVLTGVPTQTGVFNFTVSAGDDSVNAFTSMAFTLIVSPGYKIDTASPLPPGMVGVNYSQIITAVGGTGGNSFTLTSGIGGNAPPPGLTLSGNGTLSGKPTLAGSFLFNVTATDGANEQAFAQMSITITPALVITTPSPLPSASAGTSYSQTISATGGTQPYSFSISGSSPPGLTMSAAGVLSGTPSTAGPVSFTVQVTDNFSFSAFKQFQLTVAGASALLQVTPTLLAFSAVAGGDAPPPRDVSILSANGRPVNFAARIAANANGAFPTWLTVSPSTGAAPGRLVVSVNQGTMTASPAPATIQITVPGNTAQSPILVTVSLTLSTVSAQLQVTPALLRFAARSHAPATLEQSVAVSNSGGGSISFITSIQSNSSWITVTPSSGQIAPNAPVVMKVDVNTQGLSLGSHHDVIQVSSSAGAMSVPVSVFISDQGPIISVNATGVRFLARQGFGSGVPRTISVQNMGDPSTTVHWTAELANGIGADWLTFSPASGTATPTAPGNLVLTPGSSSAALPVGARYGLVRISDPAALNSPQYVMAVLDVEPATTPLAPELLPAGLFFVTTPGSSPAAQSVLVYASSTPIAFQVATTTTDGANWLTATVTAANASATIPGKISISVNAAGLSNGIYTGGVNVSIASVLRTVNVTLVVAPTLPSRAQPERNTSEANVTLQPLAASTCTPSHLAVTETALENNFAVPAGWPATVVIQLNDDCGNAVTNGSVVAGFSNGDPPLSLISDLETGTYSATWQPGFATAQMTVNVRASAATLPQATAQFIGTVNANAANPPTLIPNGAFNIFFTSATAASVGGGLAPGNVASIYGSGLVSVATSTPSVPLVTQYNGTFMLIGSVQAPIYYLGIYSPTVHFLNVQIPFELAPGQYPVIASANGALTLPETIDVVPYQPDVAYLPDGSGNVTAQHGDYTLVTPSNPAKPGENVAVYLAGMGATNPAVPSGAPTPLDYFQAVVQPVVTVDGQKATVLYAGLTPTGIGLYQINFTVPKDAKSGNLPLVITQNGVAANATTLIVAAGP